MIHVPVIRMILSKIPLRSSLGAVLTTGRAAPATSQVQIEFCPDDQALP